MHCKIISQQYVIVTLLFKVNKTCIAFYENVNCYINISQNAIVIRMHI